MNKDPNGNEFVHAILAPLPNVNDSIKGLLERLDKVSDTIHSLQSAINDLDRRIRDVEMQDEKQLDALGAMMHEGEI